MSWRTASALSASFRPDQQDWSMSGGNRSGSAGSENAVQAGTEIGAARELGSADYRPSADTPHLRIRHHPDTDTPTRNGGSGERTVGISQGATTVIGHYLNRFRFPDRVVG